MYYPYYSYGYGNTWIWAILIVLVRLFLVWRPYPCPR